MAKWYVQSVFLKTATLWRQRFDWVIVMSTENRNPHSFAQQIQNLAHDLESYVIEKRRYFHAHPELSGKEVQTTEALAAELDAIGVEYSRPAEYQEKRQTLLSEYQEQQQVTTSDNRAEQRAFQAEGEAQNHACVEGDEKTGEHRANSLTGARSSSPYPSSSHQLNPSIDPQSGLIATIRGTAPDAYDEADNPRHCIALRCDIDALPVKEETNLSFASQNEGVMHACGHDCHMAMMLGAVRMLHELRDQLRGEVRIIFQPAEEISIGSRHMIAAGALDGVETIYGAHIWSEVEAGTISIESGPRMANTDWFRVDISGSSAHGAMPHKGVDAIVVGAAIIEALQVVVSRDVSPFDPVVLTIGEFHGGVARNDMAGTAYLTGTVRSFDPKVREFLQKRMEFMVHHTARSYSATAKFEWQTGNSALINDKTCVKRAIKSAVRVLGEDALAHYEGTLSGEDFSEYLRFVPGVFAFVGGRNPEIGADHPQHSCYYNVDESVLINGSKLAAQYAFDFLNGD